MQFVVVAGEKNAAVGVGQFLLPLDDHFHELSVLAFHGKGNAQLHQIFQLALGGHQLLGTVLDLLLQ